MHLPDPPVNVRIELRDGTVIPVQSTYVGLINNIHHWEVVEDVPVDAVARLSIDMLPPHTSVTLRGGW